MELYLFEFYLAIIGSRRKLVARQYTTRYISKEKESWTVLCIVTASLNAIMNHKCVMLFSLNIERPEII